MNIKEEFLGKYPNELECLWEAMQLNSDRISALAEELVKYESGADLGSIFMEHAKRMICLRIESKRHIILTAKGSESKEVVNGTINDILAVVRGYDEG